MPTILVFFVAIFAVVIVAFLVVLAMFFNLWLTAKASGVPVTLLDLLMMRLRRVDPAQVVHSMVSLVKAGVDVEVGDLETHLLSGGDLAGVVDAMISAEKADLGIDFHGLAAIDLAGRDVVDAVNTCINPKVLLCPPANAMVTAITGVAKDGIRLAAKARVTVRMDLERLVGGAGEQTIVARVGEGIVAAIGTAKGHQEILEKPEMIAAYLLSKGLDSGTCFEILSVDIGDVDVLDNIGARLVSTRAETDKRIAQAHAEIRRAAAVAAHQEMKARTTEMEGRVFAAKSVVPLALSSVFREANMGSISPVAPVINARLRWRR